jgi:positive regulator of sigma E activity
LQQIAVGRAVDAGDLIWLTIGSAQLARMSLLAYLLPPFGMLAGAVLAGLMTPAAGDGWTFIGSIAGLMLSGAVLRLYDSRGGSGSWRVDPGFQKPGPGSV